MSMPRVMEPHTNKPIGKRRRSQGCPLLAPLHCWPLLAPLLDYPAQMTKLAPQGMESPVSRKRRMG